MGYEIAKNADVKSEDEMLVVCQQPDTGALAIVYLTKLKDQIFDSRLDDQYSAVMYVG